MMEYPCDKCSRMVSLCLAEYKREKEEWEYRLETEHPNVDCSPRPPDMCFLKNCPYELDHCPLKGGE